MTHPAQPFTSIWRNSFGLRASALALLSALSIIPTQSAYAQTFTVLHQFTGGLDGGIPMAGLSPDAAGNFYGTTEGGGTQHCAGGCGTVFKLSRRNGAQ